MGKPLVIMGYDPIKLIKTGRDRLNHWRSLLLWECEACLYLRGGLLTLINFKRKMIFLMPRPYAIFLIYYGLPSITRIENDDGEG